jgi:hypothetical protein
MMTTIVMQLGIDIPNPRSFIKVTAVLANVERPWAVEAGLAKLLE